MEDFDELKPKVWERAAKLVYKEHPGLIKDAVRRVTKYEPYYHYMRTVERIFEAFLQKRNIKEDYIQGVDIPRQAVFERTVFISVILWLYSPSVYNPNSKFPVEDGIRHELEGCLLCNKHWISQHVDDVAFQYNSNYQEFKYLVNDCLSYIKTKVVEKEVQQRQESEPLTLYQ